MKVCEMFASIQGEGATIGTPSVFIRLSGCNLRCDFCDSKYSWDEYTESSPKQVYEGILEKPSVTNVVITGGEPLLQRDEIMTLLNYLGPKYTVEIETNGTQLPLSTKRWLLYNVSPKLESSGNKNGYKPKVLKKMRNRGAIFKFVVKTPEDVKDIEDIARNIGIKPTHIFLMPEGTDVKTLKERSEWVVDECMRTGYSYSTRLHIMLWGNERKK